MHYHIFFASLLWLFGCENVGGQQAKPVPKAVGESDVGGESGKKSGDDGSDDREDDDGIGDDDDDGSSTRRDEEACNYTFSTDLSSRVETSGSAQVPIIGRIDFDMTADVEVQASGKPTSGQISLDATIASFSPNVGRSLAQNIIDSFKDPLQLTYVSESAYDKLPADMRKIACYFPPVKKIKNDAYEMEYSPAIPFIFNANTPANVDSGTVEFDVEARIIRHPTAASGTHKGKAKVTIKDGKATVDFDFGGKAPRANATPAKALRCEVDSPGTYRSVELSAFVSDDSLIVLKVEE